MKIVPLQQSERSQTESGAWQRRLAIQLAAQLPEKPQDALIVAELVVELVKAFLTPYGA